MFFLTAGYVVVVRHSSLSVTDIVYHTYLRCIEHPTSAKSFVFCRYTVVILDLYLSPSRSDFLNFLYGTFGIPFASPNLHGRCINTCIFLIIYMRYNVEERSI